MRTEYRIIATMSFDNTADRDTWYTAIKTAVVAAKPIKPVYLKAHMTKDEYNVPDPPASEAI